MFIEVTKGDFIALDTVARITDVSAVEPSLTRSYRVETKRGDKYNVTEPPLVATIKKVLNHE